MNAIKIAAQAGFDTLLHKAKVPNSRGAGPALAFLTMFVFDDESRAVGMVHARELDDEGRDALSSILQFRDEVSPRIEDLARSDQIRTLKAVREAQYDPELHWHPSSDLPALDRIAEAIEIRETADQAAPNSPRRPAQRI